MVTTMMRYYKPLNFRALMVIFMQGALIWAGPPRLRQRFVDGSEKGTAIARPSGWRGGQAEGLASEVAGFCSFALYTHPQIRGRFRYCSFCATPKRRVN